MPQREMKKYNRYKIAVFFMAIALLVAGIFIVYLLRSRPRKPPAVIPLAEKGKIAIVLDDWGYNLRNAPLLYEIKYPLTIAVLPGLAYSRDIASKLCIRGYEVILHLPMEPYEKISLEHNTIMVSMDEAKIVDILNRDLGAIPCVKGVSNHMGSFFTENPKAMRIVFRELKKRNLYFLDSLVSSKTVGSALAKKMGLPFAKRGVFLDNKEDPDYIRNQLYHLKEQAIVYGQAIGIGHDRKNTLQVLRELMPRFAKEGFKFVFVSELAE
ncbi:MAG: divergent polysaccharide deacetylase family protein [Candidatus Omnitrophota bacterium]